MSYEIGYKICMSIAEIPSTKSQIMRELDIEEDAFCRTIASLMNEGIVTKNLRSGTYMIAPVVECDWQ